MTKMSIVGTIFEKVRFRCRDERLTGKEKKICFLKYEDTCEQDQSQLSVARVPILCFRNPHNTLCLPCLPLQKNRINYCFQMFLGGLHILSIKNKGANLYGRLLGQANFKISKLRDVTLVAAFYLRYFFRKINLF